MSELKAHRIGNIISAYKIGKAFCMKTEEEVYLKSEADKVIAELKQKINEAQTELELWRDGSIISEAHQKELDGKRHSDYKRCLAMARWCRESLRLMRTYEVTEDFWNLEPGQDAEHFCKKGDFYSKWRKRWLALAEEPTWAKFLQLIHKEAK